MHEPIWSWDTDRKTWYARFSISVPEHFFLPENSMAYLSMLDDQLTTIRDRLRATANISEVNNETAKQRSEDRQHADGED